MTPHEASNVLTTLNAGYPFWKLDEKAIALWREKLLNLNHATALEAAQRVIDDVPRSPSVADFFHAYRAVRDARAKAERDEQRRLEHLSYENRRRPPLEEIKAMPGVNAAWFELKEIA